MRNIRNVRTLVITLLPLLAIFVAVQITAQSADALFQQASSKETSGDLQQAIDLYLRIPKEFSTNSNLAARALYQAGKLSEALGEAKAREYYSQICSRYADQSEVCANAQKRIAALPSAVDPSAPVRVVTPYTNESRDVAMSPDGRTLVFTVSFPDYSESLWIQDIDTGKRQEIPGTRTRQINGYGTKPFWSPDGRSVGYFQDQKLKRIDTDGKNAITLADAPQPYGGDWSSADVIVFNPRHSGPLYRVPARGGAAPVEVTRTGTEIGHRWPQFLPDGRHFLFLSVLNAGSDNAELLIGSLDSMDVRDLHVQAQAGFLVPGHVVWAPWNVQRLDLEKLELTGNPKSFPSPGFWIGPTKNGRVANRPNLAPNKQLIWFDRTGRRTGTLGAAATNRWLDGDGGAPRFSPDGRSVLLGAGGDRLVLNVSDGTGGVTAMPTGDQWGPLTWSPDGGAVALGLKTPNPGRGFGDLYAVLRGGGGVSRLWSSPEDKWPQDWARTPNGDFLLFSSLSTTGMDLFALPTGREGATPVPVARTSSQEGYGRFSPNGKWIAYQSDEVGGRYEIYLQPFPGEPASRIRISRNGGNSPEWRRDGQELYFVTPDNHLMAVPIKFSADGLKVENGTPALVFANPLPEHSKYAPAPEGDRFLINAPIEPMPPIIVRASWKEWIPGGLPDDGPAPAAPSVTDGRGPRGTPPPATNADARGRGPAPARGAATPILPTEGQQTNYRSTAQVGVFDRKGMPITLVGDPAPASVVTISPDGKRIAMSRSDSELWTYEIATQAGVSVASDLGMSTVPLWSLDGKRIAYLATRNGLQNVYVNAPDGTGTEDLLQIGVRWLFNWSAEGRLALQIGANQRGLRPGAPITAPVVVVPVDGVRQPQPLNAGIVPTGLRVSPDGRFGGLYAAEGSRTEVWVRALDAPADRPLSWQISNEGAIGMIRWRADGKEMYYLAADGYIMAVPIVTTPEFKPGKPERLFHVPENFPLTGNVNPSNFADISADGQRFIFLLSVSETAER